MHIVVEFQSGKSLAVECNGVKLAVQSCDQKDCGSVYSEVSVSTLI